MIREELYRFHLERRIRTKYVPNVQSIRTITSTHVVEIATDDPFRTQEVILDHFPGWVCVNIESDTDREYNELDFEDPRR